MHAFITRRIGPCCVCFSHNAIHSKVVLCEVGESCGLLSVCVVMLSWIISKGADRVSLRSHWYASSRWWVAMEITYSNLWAWLWWTEGGRWPDGGYRDKELDIEIKRIACFLSDLALLASLFPRSLSPVNSDCLVHFALWYLMVLGTLTD